MTSFFNYLYVLFNYKGFILSIFSKNNKYSDNLFAIKVLQAPLAKTPYTFIEVHTNVY